MPIKITNAPVAAGLSEAEIPALHGRYGKNIFVLEKQRRFFHVLWDIVREPMFLLLVTACVLYFILGKSNEGWMMMAAMLFVAAISFYQDIKSTLALDALREFTEPKVVVVRDGAEKLVASADLVPGDIIVLEEGNKVPADAMVIQANDCTIDESVITGESVPGEKYDAEGKNIIYQGTTVNSGKCYARVTATGNNTVLGKLGKSISAYAVPKTLLQQQIGRLVQRLALFGILAFVIIWLVNYLKSGDAVVSLLFGLTLAMASIPEEIPVAFSSFMALGAYHMSRLGIISRQPQTIENLGAVSVICLDKTGTITENKMEVKKIYDHTGDRLIEIAADLQLYTGNVLKYAVLASEREPFDAMEKAIWKVYEEHTDGKAHEQLQLVYEYALEGRPPMMTHVYEFNATKIIAAKGAAERIMHACKLDDSTIAKVSGIVKTFAAEGYRVIAVASAMHTGDTFPEVQDDFNWKFEGILALYDPPKKNITAVFKKFYSANIDIKIITGDFSETAVNIARQAGMQDVLKYMTGEEVMKAESPVLQQHVKSISIFARMFPEAKLKVIEALKANGEIVAMTGDGVNDGPALKSAHIGIAMGKKGTEIARQAADLILTDDNLDKVVEAVLQGRKIFSNLKKAVRYIISIHIPIILTAALPLLLGWKFPNIFTPVHVIFLEIIMGPTCSVFYEREPVEKNIMSQQPRDRTAGLFTGEELLISIVQGIIIAAGVLSLYYYFMNTGYRLEETRTIVFTTLVLSNIFLTFVNRSFNKNFIHTIRYKNNLAIPVFIISALFLIVIHLVPQVRDLFGMTRITGRDFLLCFGVAVCSVTWFEVYKTGLSKA